jgi:branched-chain amino acid transport system substrate-binding protein
LSRSRSARPVFIALTATALSLWAVTARAADAVTVGVIGRANPELKAAVDIAADIVNMPHPGLEQLPLGNGLGLPKLSGAKIAVDIADDLANPSVAAAQALRLITKNHVAALIGTGAAPQIGAASAVAERHHVPFLAPLETAPSLAGRGLGYVFRSGPLAADIGRVYARFLGWLKQGGSKLDTVALVFEDSAAGRAEAAALRDALKAAGVAVADVAYRPNADNLSAVAAALRERNCDAAIFISRTADAVLLIKTMQSGGYKPPIAIGDDNGFADPGFVAAVGNLAQGIIGRSVWSAVKADSPAAIVNRLYRATTGRDLDDAGAETIQGALVLAEAIDRAGSTDPATIRDALQQTDLKSDQLIVGYDGVRFDANGHNPLASNYLTQLQGKKYVTAWPTGKAVEKLVLPFKGWD